jgi:hypothetical protein
VGNCLRMRVFFEVIIDSGSSFLWTPGCVASVCGLEEGDILTFWSLDGGTPLFLEFFPILAELSDFSYKPLNHIVKVYNPSF